jgi:hypothetical protein
MWIFWIPCNARPLCKHALMLVRSPPRLQASVSSSSACTMPSRATAHFLSRFAAASSQLWRLPRLPGVRPGRLNRNSPAERIWGNPNRSKSRGHAFERAVLPPIGSSPHV